MLKRKTELRRKRELSNVNTPLARGGKLRHTSPKRAAAKAIWDGKEVSVKLWRAKYIGERWTCDYLGCIALARDVHEIARGIHRRGALTKPAALLCLCRKHHDEVQNWPTVRQLALKRSVCPQEYDRVKVNELRGVDIKPQPRYPFEFHQGDALEYLSDLVRFRGGLNLYDAIHASPPCQRYSSLFTTMEHKRAEHPDLVDPVRRLLIQADLPWVIENVYGAPLARGSMMPCGAMFGLRTYRHRWFETSEFLFRPRHPKHVVKSDKGSRRKEYFLAGGFISVVGDVGSYCGPAAMGIDWMTGEELSQAIPPAYTEYIGKQLLRIVEAALLEGRG